MNIKRFLIVICLFFMLTLRAEAIKIGLQTNVDEVKIASSVSAEIYDVYKKQVLYEIRPMTFYAFSSKNNTLNVTIDKKKVALNTNQVIIRPKTTGFLCQKRTWYRGKFIVRNVGSNNVTLINDIPLEQYLKGVVPSEMPSKWNQEALKAQAIAARSYAVATSAAGKHSSKGFDLVDTTIDQAYGGASAEKATTNKAVTDTKGIILVQDKKVLPTYYHASSGGQTKVWDSGSSFLKSVPSFDGNKKKNGHGVGMSQHGANNLAAKGYSAYQILSYFYKDFKFAKLSDNWDI